MSSGIVCKVWNINGNIEGKAATKSLGDSLKYILNEEKTNAKNPNINTHTEEQLDRMVQYVENDLKTLKGQYVGSYNMKTTDVKEAVKEMMAVKEFYQKTDGRAALHGIISLSEEDSKPENAAKLLLLCKDVLKTVFPDHQAIFAVHTNTDNLHVHFIVNSVGINGKKIHQPEGFIKRVLQPAVNKYAEKYGLTPNPLWSISKKSDYSTYVQNKINLRRIIDMAIEESNTIEEFVEFLEMAGFKVNIGKHISLRNENMAKAIRTHQLGPNYTRDAIVERIRDKRMAFELGEINTVAADTMEFSIFQFGKLKKYKDMTKAEKKKVIKLLREGRNPWQEAYTRNWQIARMKRETELDLAANRYIKAYSKDGSVRSALDKIIELKKELAAEKKEIKVTLKKYAPIINIYKEMKEIEKQAFLYDYENALEYKNEFEAYKELSDRLKSNYNKTPEDIAALLEEAENRILYAQSQINELSSQYVDLKKYASIKGYEIPKESLLDHINYHKLKNNSDKYKSFIYDKYYLASDNPDIIISVELLAKENFSGQRFKVTLIDRYGEIIETVDTNDNEYSFAKNINKIEKEFGLKNITRYSSLENTVKALDKVAINKETRKM